MKIELWGLAAGLGVGAAISFGFFVPYGSGLINPDAARAERQSPMIAPCEERLTPLKSQLEDLKAELAEVGDEFDRLERKRVELEGQPFDWPEDVGKSSRRPAVETLVSAAILASGDKLQVISWDCDEYPCVFAIKGRSQRYFDSFVASLTERGFSGTERLVRSARPPRPARGYVWTMGYWDSYYGSDKLRDRVSSRMDALMKPIMEPPRPDDDG